MIKKLARLVGGTSGLRGYVVAGAVYAVAEGAAIGMLIPMLTGLFGHDLRAAAIWLIPITAVVAVAWLAQLRVELSTLSLATRWRRALYERIGRQLVTVPLGFFDADRTGSIPRLVASDVSRIAGLVFVIPRLIASVLTPLTIAVFLFVTDWRLAVVAVVCVPVILVAFIVATRLSERGDADHERASSDAAARLLEFSAAQPLLRSTNSSADGRRDLDAALTERHRAARRQVFGALPTQYFGQLVVQLGFTALLLTATAVMVTRGVDPAVTVAALVAGISFLRPFGVVAGLVMGLRAVSAAVGRISALVAVPVLPVPTTPRHPQDASIDFDGVRFAYPDGDSVLDGFDLAIGDRQLTALVGRSGAGKTTVTKLAARFFDVDDGSIRVGGVDVRDCDPTELMNSISIVFQDVRLLDDTIAENIRLGRPDATDAEVREAAAKAQLLPVVERLSEGFETRVGEGGKLLSGGERQRVAIARALCKDAPIVLLDEATSSLDAENEAAVHRAIRELASNRTVVVIAHQLSTIADADQIAFLGEGRVLELGNHRQLLAQGGRYATFWRERERAAGWHLV